MIEYSKFSQVFDPVDNNYKYKVELPCVIYTDLVVKHPEVKQEIEQSGIRVNKGSMFISFEGTFNNIILTNWWSLIQDHMFVRCANLVGMHIEYVM